MSRRLWLVVALVCSLFACPHSAYAADGFIGGLQDFAGVRNVEEVKAEPVQDDNKNDYVGLLAAPAEVEQPEDTQGNIEWVTNNMNLIPWGTGRFKLIDVLSSFFGGRNTGISREMRAMLIIGPIGICFMWWGVRKALRMIMASFRKGSASV